MGGDPKSTELVSSVRQLRGVGRPGHDRRTTVALSSSWSIRPVRLTQVGYDYDGYGLHSTYQHVKVHDPHPGTWTVKVLWCNGVCALRTSR